MTSMGILQAIVRRYRGGRCDDEANHIHVSLKDSARLGDVVKVNFGQCLYL